MRNQTSNNDRGWVFLERFCAMVKVRLTFAMRDARYAYLCSVQYHSITELLAQEPELRQEQNKRMWRDM